MIIYYIFFIIAGLGMSLWLWASLDKDIIDRPLAFDSFYFLFIVRLLILVLILVGFAGVFMNSIYLGIVIAAVIVLLLFVIKFLGGNSTTRTVVGTAYFGYKAKHPGASEDEALAFAVRTRNPKWSTEKISSFLAGINNLDQLIEKIIVTEQ